METYYKVAERIRAIHYDGKNAEQVGEEITNLTVGLTVMAPMGTPSAKRNIIYIYNNNSKNDSPFIGSLEDQVRVNVKPNDYIIVHDARKIEVIEAATFKNRYVNPKETNLVNPE